MTETAQATDEQKPKPKKVKPEIVIGSNQGEARRAAAAIGLPKAAAIAIDQLTDDHLELPIGVARVPGDNASGWAKLDGATTIDLLK